MPRRASVAFVAVVAVVALAATEAAQVFFGLALLASPVSWSAAIRATTPSWLVLALLVVPVLWWLDDRPSRVTHPRRVAFHITAGACFVALHLAGSALLAEAVSVEPIGFMPRLYHLGSIFFVVDLLTWVAIVGAHHAIRRDQEDVRRDLRDARLLADLADARLSALEGRLRPDFFFNTLNAVSGLLARGQSTRAAEALAQLGSLVRTSLHDPAITLPLSKELDLVRDYIDLQTLRFPDRIRVSCDVRDQVDGVRVPSLLLVLLVEGVVDAGLATGHPFAVDVAVERSHHLDISVRHTVPPAVLEDALGNARRRLADAAPGGDLALGPAGELVLRLPSGHGSTPSLEVMP